MSSEKEGEKPSRRKPKVSWGRLIRPGLVGPKPRPKGVGDGQQVNIPAPLKSHLSDGGTQKDRDTSGWKWMAATVEGLPRQIREAVNLEGSGEVSSLSKPTSRFHAAKKSL